MRIIAGALKGRLLAPVKGRTRPTAAKVREAIFAILGPAAILEAQVLDLFAGTGALGIEALSRGASRAVFVEDHPEALKGLRRNLESLGLGERSQVLPLTVAAALKKLASPESFDLIFLDPPYGGGTAAATLTTLATRGLLRPHAYVVAEHSRRELLPETVGTLAQQTLRRYGDTQVAIYLSLP